MKALCTLRRITSLMLGLELLLFLFVSSCQLLLLASVRCCHGLSALFAGMLPIHFRLLGRLPAAQLLTLLLLSSVEVLRLVLSAGVVLRVVDASSDAPFGGRMVGLAGLLRLDHTSSTELTHALSGRDGWLSVI
ncbi:MAG TPA: hypothetical protein VJ303_00670 [Steroidobacteraceae bacterium]|nr:hypothetical protein [Steroidobacteraceae bacterium]